MDLFETVAEIPQQYGNKAKMAMPTSHRPPIKMARDGRQ